MEITLEVIKAVQDTRKIWKVLSEQNVSKEEAAVLTGVKLVGIEDCPLCDYRNSTGLSCNEACPLIGYAWDAKANPACTAIGSPYPACTAIGSPYHSWVRAKSFQEKQKYAREIVRACSCFLEDNLPRKKSADVNKAYVCKRCGNRLTVTDEGDYNSVSLCEICSKRDYDFGYGEGLEYAITMENY